VEQRSKFAGAELVDMVRIGSGTRRRIDVAVRCADDEAASGTQDPMHFLQEVGLPIEMLDGFKRNDNVDAAIGQGQGACIALQEEKIGTGEISRGCGNCRAGALGPYDRTGDLRQEGGAVSFATGDIENIEIGYKCAGEQVAMVVFDLHLPADSGGKPLASEWLRMFRRFAAKYFPHGGWDL
jgi:hypothetical protein